MSIEEISEKMDEAIELVNGLQDVIKIIEKIGNKIDDKDTKRMFATVLISEILHNLNFSSVDVFGIVETIKYETVSRQVIELVKNIINGLMKNE